MSVSVDFWFSFDSIYSYLSVTRVVERYGNADVRLIWRPFSLRAVAEQAFPEESSARARYAWRDVERRARSRHTPIASHIPFPLARADLLNRIALIAAREEWCATFAAAAFAHWFQQGVDPSVEPHLSRVMRGIARDPGPLIEEAMGAEVGALYAACNEAARALGIFGAPTFVIDHEIFWGDDRMDDALAWAKHGRVSPDFILKRSRQDS